MKLSKLSKLILLSLSTTLVFGCDDSSSSSSSDTYDIESVYWEFESTTDINDSDYSEVYLFSDDTLTVYSYDSDADDGTYDSYTTEDYSVTSTTVTIDDVDYTYTVTDSDDDGYDELNLDYTVDSVDYSDDAGELEDTSVVDDAEEESDDTPSALNEYEFDGGSDYFTVDSGSEDDELSSSGSATMTSSTGAEGDDDTAMDIDQYSGDGYGYMYYSNDSTDDSESAAEQISGSFSLETVIKQEDFAASDVALIDFADTSNYLGFKMYIESTDQTIKFKVYGGVIDSVNYSTEANTSTVIASDSWYHILAVYDEDSTEGGDYGLLTIYVDGVAEVTKDVDFELAENDDDKLVLLGGSSSSDKNFDGSVDNIAIWNDALTATEVATRAEAFGFTTD